MVKSNFSLPEHFSEKSPLFSQLNEAIFSKINVQVYARVSLSDEKMDRRDREKKYYFEILSTVSELFDEAKRAIYQEKLKQKI